MVFSKPFDSMTLDQDKDSAHTLKHLSPCVGNSVVFFQVWQCSLAYPWHIQPER